MEDVPPHEVTGEQAPLKPLHGHAQVDHASWNHRKYPEAAVAEAVPDADALELGKVRLSFRRN